MLALAVHQHLPLLHNERPNGAETRNLYQNLHGGPLARATKLAALTALSELTAQIVPICICRTCYSIPTRRVVFFSQAVIEFIQLYNHSKSTFRTSLRVILPPCHASKIKLQESLDDLCMPRVFHRCPPAAGVQKMMVHPWPHDVAHRPTAHPEF
jgi:hypothetical protein